MPPEQKELTRTAIPEGSLAAEQARIFFLSHCSS